MAKLLSGTRIYGTATVDTQVFINGTSASTSTNTGALQVAGGVGVGGNLYVGGGLNVIGSTTATLTPSGAGSVQISPTGTGEVRLAPANGNVVIAPAVGTVTINPGTVTFLGNASYGVTVYGGISLTSGFLTLSPTTQPGTINNVNIGTTTPALGTFTQVTITTSTAASSTNTGALQVAGGVGVGGGLYVGGTVTATQVNITSNNIALGGFAGLSQPGIGQTAVGYQSGSTGQQTGATALGGNAGYQTQGAYAVAVGSAAGQTSQGTQAIAIGSNAGNSSQGSYSIAIGYQAAFTSQSAGSIIISATSTNYIGTAPNQGLYITPIRADATTSATTFAIYYNPATKELTTSTAATGGGSTFGIGNAITTAQGWNLA